MFNAIKGLIFKTELILNEATQIKAKYKHKMKTAIGFKDYQHYRLNYKMYVDIVNTLEDTISILQKKLKKYS